MFKFKVGDKIRVKDTSNVRYYSAERSIGMEFILTAQDMESKHLNNNEFCCNYNYEDWELVEPAPQNIQKFKVGDRVRIYKMPMGDYNYSRDFTGMYGIITAFGNCSRGLDCSVKIDSHEEIGIDFQSLELVSECEEPCESCEVKKEEINLDYQTGDIVKCIALDVSCEADRVDYATGRQRSPLVVGRLYKVVKLKNKSYGNFVDVVSADGLGVSVHGTYASQFSKINEPTNSSGNKVGKIMSNLSTFVKNSLLSADEKLLRKYGLKDSCGDYTDEAEQLVMQKLIADNNAYLVEVATAKQAEEKASK